jgi:AGCS family alanine or glycine:cation symporter
MEPLYKSLLQVKEMVWGIPLLALLMGTGLYLTILLKGMQFRYLFYALKQVFHKQDSHSEGDISHFAALMTSLAGAIGTGTIVGVAMGISIGGLGSIFWMWITAFLGMATKYAESLLAVKYRNIDSRGEMAGGPMQYIEKGLGWKGVAILFALFGIFAAIGTGNMVQVNAISEAMSTMWDADAWFKGIVIALLTGLVILGGVKSIGHVASVIVPFMALFYVAAGLFILVIHAEKLPQAIYLIISSAFTPQASFGGFAGSSVMMALQMGAARSLFSNEAGLGISSIAAAAAKTDSPGRQGMITMTGALLSTVIICSITGLVLAVTNVLGMTNEHGESLNAAAMAITAFESTIPGGSFVVSTGLMLFAFTTLIAWAYYGEKCYEYLFGKRYIVAFRIVYTLLVIPGAAMKMEMVWVFADIMNGLMAVPNLIALIALSGTIAKETNTFLQAIKAEEPLAAAPERL